MAATAHFHRIPRALLARLWADRSRTRADIALELGISARALTVQVKTAGLDLRGHNTKRPCVTDNDLFRHMWLAGVASDAIARHFGIAYRTVANTSKRLALPQRQPGKRPDISLRDFLMAHRMMEKARSDMAAFRGRRA